jgi:hypothetical protein
MEDIYQHHLVDGDLCLQCSLHIYYYYMYLYRIHFQPIKQQNSIV